MQIPWLFPILFFSLTFNKIPWLFPDFCQVWNFPDFSLTAAHPVTTLFCENIFPIDMQHFAWFCKVCPLILVETLGVCLFTLLRNNTLSTAWSLDPRGASILKSSIIPSLFVKTRSSKDGVFVPHPLVGATIEHSLPNTLPHIVWWLGQARVSWTFPRPHNIGPQWHSHIPHQRTAYHLGSRKWLPLQAKCRKHPLQSQFSHGWAKTHAYTCGRHSFHRQAVA